MLTPVADADGGSAGRVAQIIHREGRWLDIVGGGFVGPPQTN
jgi:hypothetical protein